MNELEQNYWNTEYPNSLLDRVADEGAAWLKFWPTRTELLISISQGKMGLFLESVGHELPNADGEGK